MIFYPRNDAGPASPARLRAMARQIARPMLEDLGEFDGFDFMLDAMLCLTFDDQDKVRELVAAFVGDGALAAQEADHGADGDGAG